MGSLEEEAGFGFGGCLGLEVVCDMVVGEEMGFGVREEIQLGREEEEGKGRGGVWGMEPEVGASVCSSCSSSWGIDIISGSGSIYLIFGYACLDEITSDWISNL